jgi:hypothetical protein
MDKQTPLETVLELAEQNVLSEGEENGLEDERRRQLQAIEEVRRQMDYCRFELGADPIRGVLEDRLGRELDVSDDDLMVWVEKTLNRESFTRQVLNELEYWISVENLFASAQDN